MINRFRIQAPCIVALLILSFLPASKCFAWGHDGHSMIDRIAGAKLPSDVPEFLRSPAALEALEFYGPVPDSRQWRSSEVKDLGYAMAPEHFLDLEWADLAGPLPRRRYDFIKQLHDAQPNHPDIKMDPEHIGLLPYAASEYYLQLLTAMHDYRDIVAAKQDTRPVQAEIVFIAGILGHWVGDGSQPMHVSIQYDGWTGPNPNGYTTDKKVHTRFEGDFVHENIRASDFSSLVPEKPEVIQDVFANFMIYLRHSNSLIEKTYQIEKAGGFNGAGTPEGRAFVDERLAAGTTKLRDLIYTAWIKSAEPVKPYNSN
jgi:hypothetical protein